MKVVYFILFSSILFGQTNWHQIPSPGGANVNSIFKVSDSIFIAGIQDGSAYRSSDEGKTWEKVISGNNTDANAGTRDIIFNSRQDILFSTFVNGIYRSSDKGVTWIISGGGGEKMASSTSGFLIGADNVHSNDALTFSIDSGKSWSYLPHPWISGWVDVTDIIAKGTDFFIITDDSIMCTPDSGKSWNRFGSVFPGRIYDLLFLNDSEILAASDNGILYSTDSAKTWVYRNTGITPPTVSFSRLYLEGKRIYGCSSIGLFYTDDYGLNWYQYNNYLIQRTIASAGFTDNEILVSTVQGVFKVFPDRWVNSSYNMSSYSPKSIRAGNSNDIVYNTSIGLFKSTDGGSNWIPLGSFNNGVQDIIVQDSIYLVQANDYYFYVSPDYGNTWQVKSYQKLICTGLAFSKQVKYGFYYTGSYYNQGGPPSMGFFYSVDFGSSLYFLRGGQGYNLTILPGDTIITNFKNFPYYIEEGIYWTVGPYGTFISISQGLQELGKSCISVDKFKNVYSCSGTGIYSFSWQSSKWTRIDSIMLNPTKIFFDKNNYMLIIKNGQLYVSLVGKGWFDVTPAGLGGAVTNICMDSSGYYYAIGNMGKIFKTNTPSLINTLPSAPFLISPGDMQLVSPDSVKFKWNWSSPLTLKYSLLLSNDSTFNSSYQYDVDDNFLIIPSLTPNKKYFWKVNAYNEIGWGSFSNASTFFTGTTSIAEHVTTVLNYQLDQNFPNPFNPYTEIHYQLAKPGYVTLSVFDVLGKEIAVLVNGYKKEGSYSVEFESSGVASGIYIYRLKTGNYSAVRKMILLK